MPEEPLGGPSPGQARLDRSFALGVEWARWAVTRWADFPVDQNPRPLVLAGQRVIADRGFATGDAKLAFIEGVIESVVALPGAVLGELTRPGRPAQSRVERPLRIVGAELGEAEFVTDRGSRLLPAWRLTAEDALGPIWVLDPDVADWHPAPGAGGSPPNLPAPAHDPFVRVEVGPDDRQLILHSLGSAPEYEHYPTAEVVESPQAIALVAVGVDAGRGGWRPAIGFMHRVPALLQQPLGSRVFVDLHGNAGQAIRAAVPAQAP